MYARVFMCLYTYESVSYYPFMMKDQRKVFTFLVQLLSCLSQNIVVQWPGTVTRKRSARALCVYKELTSASYQPVYLFLYLSMIN